MIGGGGPFKAGARTALQRAPAMSDLAAFKEDIEAAWEARDTLSPGYAGKYREAVDKVLGLLDNGRFRVAEK